MREHLAVSFWEKAGQWRTGGPGEAEVGLDYTLASNSLIVFFAVNGHFCFLFLYLDWHMKRIFLPWLFVLATLRESNRHYFFLQKWQYSILIQRLKFMWTSQYLWHEKYWSCNTNTWGVVWNQALMGVKWLNWYVFLGGITSSIRSFVLCRLVVCELTCRVEYYLISIL